MLKSYLNEKVKTLKYVEKKFNDGISNIGSI